LRLEFIKIAFVGAVPRLRWAFGHEMAKRLSILRHGAERFMTRLPQPWNILSNTCQSDRSAAYKLDPTALLGAEWRNPEDVSPTMWRQGILTKNIFVSFVIFRSEPPARKHSQANSLKPFAIGKDRRDFSTPVEMTWGKSKAYLN